jgi:hypothetical protein
MTPALRSRVIDERNLLLSMEISLFGMPYIFLMFAPKIGMNCTRSYVKGISQKKTSPCSSHASLLRKRAYQKKPFPCS